MSSADCASLAITDLTEALLHPSTEAPFSKIGVRQLAALRQHITLFQTHQNKTVASPKSEQTSPARSVGDPSPQGVAQRTNAPSPRVGTQKTPATTIPYSHTKR